MQHGDKTVQNTHQYGIQVTKDLTIPKLFFAKAREYSKEKVAMREKEFGVWQPITWQNYFENVKYLSLGLIRLVLRLYRGSVGSGDGGC